MTKSKLDPRTAAAEKRMMDAVLRPTPPIDPNPQTTKFCEDLMAKFEAAEEKKD